MVTDEAPTRSTFTTRINSESTNIERERSPQEDSFKTNSVISVPLLTPLARILGGPSIHDWIVPLNPATRPAAAATNVIHTPWPHSSSLSVSGNIRSQTSTDNPTQIPAIAEIKLDLL